MLSASLGKTAPRVSLPKKNRMVLVSDLDWTMVNHSDVHHRDLLMFNKTWMKQFSEDSLLIYSSGRSPTLYKELAVRRR